MSGSGALPDYMMQPQSRLKVVAGYALQQKLGSGSFAVVYKGVKLQPTGSYEDYSAIKAIARTSEKLTKKVLQNLEVEISILRTYRHRNIVCMHDVQKTANHFYLILEFCAGGDVQGLIRSRKDRRLSEGLTRRLMRDLAHGLAFLWKQQLIHRDIKPQNLLLTGPLPLDELNDPERSPEAEEQRRRANFATHDFCLKIADFGFARHLQSTSLAETLCGSPLYMAPEILQHHRCVVASAVCSRLYKVDHLHCIIVRYQKIRCEGRFVECWNCLV
jgi:serine/threonine-protein kinase ULK2